MYLEVSKFSDTPELGQEQRYLLVLISTLKDSVTGSSKGWCVGTTHQSGCLALHLTLYVSTPHHSLLSTLFCNCGEEIRPFRPRDVPVQYSNNGGPMYTGREFILRPVSTLIVLQVTLVFFNVVVKACRRY